MLANEEQYRLIVDALKDDPEYQALSAEDRAISYNVKLRGLKLLNSVRKNDGSMFDHINNVMALGDSHDAVLIDIRKMELAKARELGLSIEAEILLDLELLTM